MTMQAFEFLEKEGCGFIRETVVLEKPVHNEQVIKRIVEQVVGEASDKGGRPKKNLAVRIAAIHDCITKNATEYHADELKASIPTWTTPYNKPVITDHESGEVSRIAGRIMLAEMGKHNNKECLIFTVHVKDKDAAERVIDGRYTTVSIGARVKTAKCSVCQSDWAKGDWCDHEPGRYYLKDDEDPNSQVLCTLVMGGISGHELSFVTVPADEDAMVISVEDLRKPSSKDESVQDDELGLLMLDSETIEYVSTDGSSVVFSSVEESGRSIIGTLFSRFEAADIEVPETQEESVEDQVEGTETEDETVEPVEETEDEVVEDEAPAAEETADDASEADAEDGADELEDEPAEVSETDAEADETDESADERSEADAEEAPDSDEDADASDSDAASDDDETVADDAETEDEVEAPATESEKDSEMTDELRKALVTLYIERGIADGSLVGEDVDFEELLSKDLDEVRALLKEQSDDGQSLAEKYKQIAGIARTESKMIGSDEDKTANASVRTRTTMRIVGKEGRKLERSFETVAEDDNDISVRIVKPNRR